MVHDMLEEIPRIRAASPAAAVAKRKSRWVLAGSRLILVRQIELGDKEALRRFFDGLSDQSRYQRFFYGVRTISEETLDFLVGADGHSHVGLVMLGPDHRTIIADGRLVSTGTREGEVAIAVSDAWQGKGVGRALLRLLLEEARELGVERIDADYLTENRRMIGLLRDAQFDLCRDARNGITGHGKLFLPAGLASTGHLELTQDPLRPRLGPA